MILQAVVLGDVIAAPGLERGTELGIVPQFCETLFQGLARRQLLEIPEGHLILRLDPLGHAVGFTHIFFQPSIGIGHLDPVIHIHMIDRFSGWIR